MRLLHCRFNKITRSRVARGAAAALLLAVGATPALLRAGASPTGELFMPQGASSPVASGDYIGTSATGGLDIPYRYFIEVPPGLSRLVVGLFDPDIGTGGAGEANANRDRDRGNGYSSVSTYALVDPSGRLAASQTSATLSASDNAWATLLDSNAPPASPAPTLLSHQFATATAATALVVNIPAGSAGDMLIATIALTRDNGNPNPGTPTGWTILNEGDCPTGGGDTSCRLEVFYRVAVAGDTSVSFGWASSEKAIGSVLRYTPVNGAPAISTAGTETARPRVQTRSSPPRTTRE